MSQPNNDIVADRLEEVARLLAGRGENPFRVSAYRNAAATLRVLDEPCAEILAEHGLAGLRELPGIGESIARSIQALLLHGEIPALERLRVESDPRRLIGSVPGLGPRLAERLHLDLGIATLEELEAAAHDGRLALCEGIGPRRLAAIRDSLAQRLDRGRSAVARTARRERIPVDELLDVDREYRERAAAGRLRRIAPRRMNPAGEAWLPVLRTRRGPRRYTALFSNTPAAHRLGRTRDWVVLAADGPGGERLATVVTAGPGPLQGRRVVRGRELECAAHYRAREQAMAPPREEPGAAPESRRAG